ncbi:conserved hypothetical protein [Beggiatoa sp. PS]|nr:conserved hypothetical protein [Beggiatoa sp. PS]
MTTIPFTQTETIDIEINPEIKKIILRAAQVKMMSMSTFLINAAYENAKQTLKEHETLTLSLEEGERLITLLENPPEPNDKLKAAMRQYRQVTENAA